MKWLVYVLLFLGIMVALTAIYWVLWVAGNAIFGNYTDFWTMAGVLSTVNFAILMIKEA